MILKLKSKSLKNLEIEKYKKLFEGWKVVIPVKRKWFKWTVTLEKK